MSSSFLSSIVFSSHLPTSLSEHLAKQQPCHVQAILIGNQIDVKSLTKNSLLRKEPVIAQLQDNSVALIYTYGAIVFFNTAPAVAKELIALCKTHARYVFTEPENEKFSVIIRPDDKEGIDNDKVSIQAVTTEHIEIIGDALAKSVSIEYHENRIGKLFDKIEPIARSLKEKGKLGYRSSELLKHIGSGLMMAQDMMGNIEVTEKPVLLWYHPTLEPLHEQLVEDLELFERQRVLDRKISLIARTSEISLDVLQQAQGHRLEWYIIFLIAIEILLQLYSLFLKPLL